MPFINVGSGNDLILETPTNRTQNWDSRFKSNFTTPITIHDHTGSGKGRLITTAALTVNSVTGVKIRLDNDEYLRARNAANSANLNLIKANTSDKLDTGIDFANIAMINNTFIQGRNNADSGYVNIIKVNASDKLETSVDFAVLGIINNLYIHGRNNADSGDVNIIKVNTSDKLETTVDFAALGLINNTFLHARNNANSGDINIVKINTSDKIASGADFANLAMINNTFMQGRNAADSGYINAWKVNASDKLEFGVDTIHNGTLKYKADRVILDKTFTIPDNATAIDITGASVVEAEGKSFKLYYSNFIDATSDLLKNGCATFTFIGGVWGQTRHYSQDDSLVIFTIVSGQVKVTTPVYAGYVNGTMTYTIVEH